EETVRETRERAGVEDVGPPCAPGEAKDGGGQREARRRSPPAAQRGEVGDPLVAESAGLDDRMARREHVPQLPAVAGRGVGGPLPRPQRAGVLRPAEDDERPLHGGPLPAEAGSNGPPLRMSSRKPMRAAVAGGMWSIAQRRAIVFRTTHLPSRWRAERE